MSQIHKAKITTQKLENEKYRIEVIYNCQIFETEINEKDFSSQFIEIEKLEYINNGNIKYDNLKFKIEYEENKNNLNITINTTFKQEHIKEINEKVVINLQKKGDVDQATKHMLGNCKGRLLSNGFNSNMIIEMNINGDYCDIQWYCENSDFSYSVSLTSEDLTTDIIHSTIYPYPENRYQDKMFISFKEYFLKIKNDEYKLLKDKKDLDVLKHLLIFINNNYDIKSIKKAVSNRSIILIINTQFNINKKEKCIIDIIKHNEFKKNMFKNNKTYEILETIHNQRYLRYIIKYYN